MLKCAVQVMRWRDTRAHRSAICTTRPICYHSATALCISRNLFFPLPPEKSLSLKQSLQHLGLLPNPWSSCPYTMLKTLGLSSHHWWKSTLLSPTRKHNGCDAMDHWVKRKSWRSLMCSRCLLLVVAWRRRPEECFPHLLRHPKA